MCCAACFRLSPKAAFKSAQICLPLHAPCSHAAVMASITRFTCISPSRTLPVIEFRCNAMVKASSDQPSTLKRPAPFPRPTTLSTQPATFHQESNGQYYTNDDACPHIEAPQVRWHMACGRRNVSTVLQVLTQQFLGGKLLDL